MTEARDLSNGCHLPPGNVIQSRAVCGEGSMQSVGGTDAADSRSSSPGQKASISNVQLRTLTFQLRTSHANDCAAVPTTGEMHQLHGDSDFGRLNAASSSFAQCVLTGGCECFVI